MLVFIEFFKSKSVDLSECARRKKGKIVLSHSFCVRYRRSYVLKNPAIIDMIEFFSYYTFIYVIIPIILIKRFVPCKVHLDHQFEVFLNSV